MPIYEFHCGHCDHDIDGIFPWDAIPTVIPCTYCGKGAARVYRAPAIHFKGSGFHNTDYKRKRHHGAKEDPTPQETKEKADASKSSTTDKPS